VEVCSRRASAGGVTDAEGGTGGGVRLRCRSGCGVLVAVTGDVRVNSSRGSSRGSNGCPYRGRARQRPTCLSSRSAQVTRRRWAPFSSSQPGRATARLARRARSFGASLLAVARVRRSPQAPGVAHATLTVSARARFDGMARATTAPPRCGRAALLKTVDCIRSKWWGGNEARDND